MSEKLQAFLTEQNNKKSRGSLLGSGSNGGTSSAGEGDSDSSRLLSWVPSVSIPMPNVFSGGEKTDTSSSSPAWFAEAKSDPLCPALVSSV